MSKRYIGVVLQDIYFFPSLTLRFRPIAKSDG
jgi:hypothetical protein